MKTLQKAWYVGTRSDIESISTFQECTADTVRAKSRNDAKAKASRELNIPYTEVHARRNPSSDLVEYNGRECSRDLANDIAWNRKLRKEWFDKMTSFISENKGALVYIWSDQWGEYWRPGGAGYTSNILDAGQYDIDDAWSRVSHCGPEKGIEFRLVHDI